MQAKVERITLPQDKRIICVSDIHGSLDLFKRLLDKIRFNEDDILMILGDIYLKGTQGPETLKAVMALFQSPNVHVLRGNCDVERDWQTEEEKAWLNSLPHIIETEKYTFVHSGLTSSNLEEQEARTCIKTTAFMEKGLRFEKYVITGDWPTNNYTHKIPCCNPIIDEESKIVAIDGGTVVKAFGQLNAFFITEEGFSFDFVEDLPVTQIEKPQAESGGTYNITWLDRFMELVEDGGEFGLYRHIQSGRVMSLPKCDMWIDKEGRLCNCNSATDYHLPVCAGETVSVIHRFSDRLFAKKNGVIGWIEL